MEIDNKISIEYLLASEYNLSRQKGVNCAILLPFDCSISSKVLLLFTSIVRGLGGLIFDLFRLLPPLVW